MLDNGREPAYARRVTEPPLLYLPTETCALAGRPSLAHVCYLQTRELETPLVLGLPHHTCSPFLVLLRFSVLGCVSLLKPGRVTHVVWYCLVPAPWDQPSVERCQPLLVKLFCREVRNCCSTRLTFPTPLLECVTSVVFTLGNSFQNIYMVVGRSKGCETDTAASANQ